VPPGSYDDHSDDSGHDACSAHDAGHNACSAHDDYVEHDHVDAEHPGRCADQPADGDSGGNPADVLGRFDAGR
jgi:hypothetical protein